MEPDNTGVAEVSLLDLLVIRAALNSAYHQNTVFDLSDQYRKLQSRTAPSKLTLSLQNALTLVSTYIELSQEPPEETPPDE